MVPAHMPDRRSGWIPWIFVGGMLLVVAVNGALIFFAFDSWTGLAADHAYERGRQYNRALQASERQDALGWSLHAHLYREPSGAAMVVEALDREGRGLEGLVVEVLLERPLGKPDPQRVMLVPEGPGRYAGRLAALAKGQWNVLIAASSGTERMYATQRLAAP
jgi:nitrogen fixation protein FixH